MMHDDPLFRVAAANVYRDAIVRQLGHRIPQLETADELIAYVGKADTSELEAKCGWRTDRPFPGSYAPPEKMPYTPGWKLICGCKLYEGDVIVGTIFTTFVAGRPAGVVVIAPDQVIPASYTPIH